MSTFGVWDPYWNGLDRFEHDDFAGMADADQTPFPI